MERNSFEIPTSSGFSRRGMDRRRGIFGPGCGSTGFARGDGVPDVALELFDACIMGGFFNADLSGAATADAYRRGGGSSVSILRFLFGLEELCPLSSIRCDPLTGDPPAAGDGADTAKVLPNVDESDGLPGDLEGPAIAFCASFAEV